MKSTTEEGARLTDSVSSRTNSNQVGLSPTSSRPHRAQRDKAEENLTAKCPECNFIPMPMRWQPSSPSRRRGFPGCLRVDIWTELVSCPPFSVIFFISAPGSSYFKYTLDRVVGLPGLSNFLALCTKTLLQMSALPREISLRDSLRDHCVAYQVFLMKRSLFS